MTSNRPECVAASVDDDVNLRIAYLTGRYIDVSPFVYIYREVSSLRRMGIEIETVSVRKTPPEEIRSAEQAAESRTTHFLLPCSLRRLLAVQARLLGTRPRSYLAALRLALSTRPPGWRAFAYQLAYFLEATLLSQLVRERDIAHVHNHHGTASGTVAMLAAALGGFTYSMTLHGPGIFAAPEFWRLDKKIERALFVCCISSYCRSQAMVWALPQTWDRLHIVHCGVDPGQFTPTSQRGAGNKVLYVGRLAAVKGLPLLLRAAAELRAAHPDLEVTIIGDGPDRDDLRSLVDDLNLSSIVRFLGEVPNEVVREELQTAHVFVLPSFSEGLPVVLMEAMAAGVPVVSTQIAGIPELVEDNISGLLVRPADAEHLAAKIERLLRDGELRAGLARNARERVERDFHTDKEVAWLREVMVGALRGNRASVRSVISQDVASEV
jgi:colanic acid/amylovoran biosynthesis glycosyltransferase